MVINVKIIRGLAVFFLFFVGLMLVFWPSLGGQKIFNDDYAHLTGYNLYKDFGNSLKEGHLQLWLSSYMGGFPVYLTQIGLFNPIGLLLFRFFDYILAYNWLAFFHFLFGGLAMYWFIRNLKLSISASILAGFAWALSFNNIQYGAIPILSSLYLFIPLFFGIILKLHNIETLNRSYYFYLFFGILISAFGLTNSFTNVVFYTFIAGLAWAVFLDKKFLGRAFWSYILIVIASAILASFWLLPVLNYLPHTLRGEAVSASVFYDYLKIGDILRFFYPFIELPGFGSISFLSGIANLYIGFMPLILVLIGFFLWRKDRNIIFWAGLFLFAFSMRLWFFPIFQWTQFLPLFNRFRAPFHWYTLAFFSLAILSAYGLDYLAYIKESRWFKNFVKCLGIFAAVNFIFILSANIIFKFWSSSILKSIISYFDRNYFAGKKLPIEHYHAVIEKVFYDSINSFSLFDYRFLISFIFILIGATIFVLYQKNYINLNGFKILVVTISILNLVLIWQNYYNFTPRGLIENNPRTVAFLKNRPDYKNFRFYRFYPPEMYQEFKFYNVSDNQDYNFQTLASEINPYFMDGFGGGDPFRSARVSDVLNEIGYEIPATYAKSAWIKSNDLTLNQKISRFSSRENQNLLSMLNIKYIFSSFKLNNLKLVYETTATEKNIPVYIYENPKVMPRIYFAKNVKFVDSKNALEELLKIKDFRESSLIECVNNCSQPSSKLQAPSSLTIETFEPQLVKVKTNRGGWLIYSDANLPTWEAHIDGQKTEIYTANYLFKSVFVPKGEHEVMFKYPGLWGQDKAAFRNLISNF